MIEIRQDASGQSTRPVLWLFREFVSEIGHRRCIAEWCKKELEVAGKVKFRQMLKELAVTPRSGWRMPHYRVLTGYSDMGEIRFKANKIEHRPIGFFGPLVGEYTMLLGVKERGNKFEKKQAEELADRRRIKVLGDRRRSEIYEY